MFPVNILENASALLEACRKRGWRLAVAESCTGGLLGGAITAIPGSSDVMQGGFVTYANAAKTTLLGVGEGLLSQYGAVSEVVAQAMAEGALNRMEVEMALSVTGVAGPGASECKPVGLVFMGCAVKGRKTVVEKHQFFGDRANIRRQTVQAALGLGLKQAKV